MIEKPDVLLIGSGIMSANLGALLKCLDPSLRIQVVEVTDQPAQESSHGWNNAGTGHAGICELSYTPHQNADGTVDVSKAIEIFEQFEKSKQFWGYAVAQGMVDSPREFINPVPHISFVHGQQQVDFLRARHKALSAHPFFREMEFTTDRNKIAEWAPLLMEGRGDVPVAATKMKGGTDVNFGAISRKLLAWLVKQSDCRMALAHRVIDLHPVGKGWEVRVKNLETKEIVSLFPKFVFVGAGGGSLGLLQKSGIEESKGLGGFPIGGQWLVCDKPEIVSKHQAKVYGQALDAAPTMAVPHLDTRILDGKKTLLFGPFAAWTTKFLHKKGSYSDLPFSIRTDNIATLVNIAIHNVDLLRYMIQQGLQSVEDRMDVLHVYYPAAKAEDWKLIDAGIRVQAIKKTDGQAGIVHYGTEVITNHDRTISALLGASPGASCSVSIVMEVIEHCFQDLIQSEDGKARLKKMIPTYGIDIKAAENASKYQELAAIPNLALGLE